MQTHWSDVPTNQGAQSHQMLAAMRTECFLELLGEAQLCHHLDLVRQHISNCFKPWWLVTGPRTLSEGDAPKGLVGPSPSKDMSSSGDGKVSVDTDSEGP